MLGSRFVAFDSGGKHNELVWPFTKRNSRVANADAWIAVVGYERHMERLIEANLERQNRTFCNFAAVDELLKVQERKPFVVIVNAFGTDLAELRQRITSEPCWEFVTVISLERHEDNDQSNWPDSGFTGAAAVVTQLEK